MNEKAHDNAFDVLRMTAAAAVLYSHSFPLLGLPEPEPLPGLTWGRLAVAVFFGISGFLVAQSWESDSHGLRFLARRALRIFPGLLVLALLSALVLGPAVTVLPLAEYFSAAATWSYIGEAGMGLGGTSLPGVFADNPFPGAVNGSLWTLEYEILMYIGLALAGALLPHAWLGAASFGSALLLAIFWLWRRAADLDTLPVPGLWRLGVEVVLDWLAWLGVFFCVGTCLQWFRSRVPFSAPVAATGLGVLPFVDNPLALTGMLWIAVPYAAVVFALAAPRWLQLVRGYDYSYGIYIYAFPVQQLCAQVEGRWIEVLLLSAAVTLAAAAISWHLIEKPALTLKKRLKRAPRGVCVPGVRSLLE